MTLADEKPGSIDATACDSRVIAFFLPALHGGGSEHVALLMADGFRERGYTVHLVVAHATGSLLDAVPDCVELVDLGAGRTVFAARALVGYLRRTKPLALLSVINHANVIALLAARLANVGTITLPRVGFPLSTNRQRGWIDRCAVFFARMTYPWSNRVISVSDDVAADVAVITRMDPSRILTIYNPCLRPELGERAAEKADHPWFYDDQIPVIVAMGRLVPMKDFSLLIAAFAEVRSAVPARLVILGEGPLKELLIAQSEQLGIAADVLLPGFVTNPYAYLSRATLFVLSSRGEGLPNALVEALALKVPAVATDCLAGPREILDDGRLGELVPVGDQFQLTEAILRVLRDGMVSTADDVYLQRYKLSHCIDRYEETIAELSAQLHQ